MASVYILYSSTLGKYYIGSCKEMISRINDHLSKYFPNAYTAKVRDWVLFFQLDGLSYSQARKVEMYIKKMKSKVYIQNLRKYPELAGKLKNLFK